MQIICHIILKVHDIKQYTTSKSNLAEVSNTYDLSSMLGNVQESIGQDMLEIARRRYTWATIARQYESLY